MSIDLEPLRYQAPQVAEAAINFVDAIAGVTAEVVVVTFAGHFVALRFAGKFDGRQPVLFDQSFEGPIHGRNTQGRNVSLSCL
jgi:hypothetical protein